MINFSFNWLFSLYNNYTGTSSLSFSRWDSYLNHQTELLDIPIGKPGNVPHYQRNHLFQESRHLNAYKNNDLWILWTMTVSPTGKSFKTQLTLKDYLLQKLPTTQENAAFWDLFLIIHCLPLRELALSISTNAIPTQISSNKTIYSA